MRKIIISCLVVISVAFLISCNGLSKMAKHAGDVKYEVTPNPLEEHGDSVAISIKVNYPVKYFGKKIVATVIPVLKTPAGDKEFSAVSVNGESVEGAKNKVNNKEGGTITYTSRIAYTPDMRAADVEIKVNGAYKKKSVDFARMKIADATITTPLLVMSDDKVIMAKDDFKKIIPVNYSGKLYYVISTAGINSSFQMKKIGIDNVAQLKGMNDFINSEKKKGDSLRSVSISAYASPDGPEDVNGKLADGRSKSSNKYLIDQLKKLKLKIANDPNAVTTKFTNEDWDGFQSAMQNSNFAQKDMVMRILSSYSGDQRKAEMKKMAMAYKEIADNVLPLLRRAEVTIHSEMNSKTDRQIDSLASANPDSLNAEEVLYSLKLSTDKNKMMNTLKSGERRFPNDWRMSNNVGCMLFNDGKTSEARDEFNKADAASANNPVVKNNIGATYRKSGDRKTASTYYDQASGSGSDDIVNSNKGLVDIQNGNYSSAVSNYGSTQSFNAALAKLLSGDKSGAQSTLSTSADGNSAMGFYLAAVIAARNGDSNGAVSNLKSAIAKDGSLKAMARDDREFLKWFSNGEFKSAVQ